MPPESRAESELSIPRDLLLEVQNQLPAARGGLPRRRLETLAYVKNVRLPGSPLARVTRSRLSLAHERRTSQVVASGL